jgi:hypothetical protein
MLYHYENYRRENPTHYGLGFSSKYYLQIGESDLKILP